MLSASASCFACRAHSLVRRCADDGRKRHSSIPFETTTTTTTAVSLIPFAFHSSSSGRTKWRRRVFVYCESSFFFFCVRSSVRPFVCDCVRACVCLLVFLKWASTTQKRVARPLPPSRSMYTHTRTQQPSACPSSK